MALDLTANLTAAKIAVIMNQALFAVAAPNEGQLAAQAKFVADYTPFAYKSVSGEVLQAGEVAAITRLLETTLQWPQVAALSTVQLITQVWHNTYGLAGLGEITQSNINFLINTYGGNKVVIARNIILQFANSQVGSTAAEAYVQQVKGGTAEFSKSLFPAGNIDNDAPTDIVDAADGNATLTVSESAIDGASVGTLKAVDADVNDTHTFALVSPSNIFAVNAATGEVTLKTGASALLNAGTYSINVKATDAAGASVTKTISIVVTNDPQKHIIPLTLGIDVVAGTPNDDTFVTNGIASALGGDTLDGLGGNDTYEIRATLGGLVSGVRTTNIETVSAQLSNDIINPLIVNMTSMVGVQDLKVEDSTGDVTFQAIRKDFVDGPARVLVKNNTGDPIGDLTLQFQAAALAGANDRVNLTIDGTAGDFDVTMVGGNLETLNLAAVGAPSFIDDLVVQGMNRLNITGDANLTIGNGYGDDLKGNNPALTEVNASGYSGNISVFLQELPFDNVGYTGGSGNDEVFIGNSLAAGQTRALNGGGGNNILHMIDQNGLPGVDLNVLSNFQTAQFDQAMTANFNVISTAFDGVERMIFAAGIENGVNARLTRLGGSGPEWYVIGNNAGFDNISIDLDFGADDSALIPSNGDGSADAARIESTDTDLLINLSSNEIETFTFTKSGGGTNSIVFSDDALGQDLEDLRTIIIDGLGGGVVNLADAGGANANDITLIDGSATNASIRMDFHGLDELTLQGSNVTIRGGSAGDFLRGSDQDDIIDGNGGNDLLSGFEGDDRVSGGAGFDRLKGFAGADVLNGGTEADVMDGDAGQDTFIVDAGNIVNPANLDVIRNLNYDATLSDAAGLDFATGVDKIDFAGIQIAGVQDVSYREIAGAADYDSARALANALFLSDANLVYTSVEVLGGPFAGVIVFADTNKAQLGAEEAVHIVGANLGNVAAGDIIAGV